MGDDLEVDVFESLSEKASSAADSDSQSVPLFNLGSVQTEEAKISKEVEGDDSTAAEEAEAAKLATTVAAAIDSAPAAAPAAEKSDASSLVVEKSQLSEKDRILNRVSEAINLRSFTGEHSPRTPRVGTAGETDAAEIYSRIL